MKIKLLKSFSALLLTVCFASVLVLSVACNNKNNNADVSDSSTVSSSFLNGDSGKSGDSSGSGGGNGGNSGQQGGEEDLPKKVDRSDVNAGSIASEIMTMSIKDVVSFISGEDRSLLDDLYVGDLVNVMITSKDFGASANVDNITFDLYDNGEWKWRVGNKKLNPIINKILNYKLDGSEPLVLTKAELGNYGTTSLIGLTDLKDNGVLYPVIQEQPILNKILETKVSTVAGLFGDDNNERILALYDVVGDYTVGDVAELFGVDFELPEDVSQTLLSFVIGEFVDSYEYVEENGLKAFAEYLVSYAFRALLSEFGATSVVEGVTISDIVIAAMKNDVDATYGYAEAIYDEAIAKILSIAQSEEFDEIREFEIGDEKTLGDLLDEILSASFDDALKALTEFYGEISEKIESDPEFLDELYIKAQAAYGEFVAEYGDKEVVDGVTLNDIIAFVSDPESESGEKVLAKLIAYADEYAQEYFDGATAEELFDEYYGAIKDEKIYGEYTVGDVFEGIRGAEDPCELFAVVMTEIYKLSDLVYALEQVAPYAERYGDVELIKNGETVITVANVYALLQNYAYDPDNFTALVKVMPISFIAQVFGVDVTEYAFSSEKIEELYKKICALTVGDALDGGVESLLCEYYDVITVTDLIALR